MSDKIIIYGKDDCPYTTRAREDYKKANYEVVYKNVLNNDEFLQEMLKYSRGVRSVPVIIDEAGNVTIGYGSYCTI